MTDGLVDLDVARCDDNTGNSDIDNTHDKIDQVRCEIFQI